MVCGETASDPLLLACRTLNTKRAGRTRMLHRSSLAWTTPTTASSSRSCRGRSTTRSPTTSSRESARYVYVYLRASHHHILSCRRFLCTVWLFYGICHTCFAGYFAAVLHTRASCLVVRLSRKFSSIGQESQSAPLAIFCSLAALAAFSPFAQSAASR